MTTRHYGIPRTRSHTQSRRWPAVWRAFCWLCVGVMLGATPISDHRLKPARYALSDTMPKWSVQGDSGPIYLDHTARVTVASGVVFVRAGRNEGALWRASAASRMVVWHPLVIVNYAGCSAAVPPGRYQGVEFADNIEEQMVECSHKEHAS